MFVVKNTNMTARLKYSEHSTPNRDENLRALAFLGNDIGNNINNEKMRALKIYPVLLSSLTPFPNHFKAVSFSAYVLTIFGMAFLI